LFLHTKVVTPFPVIYNINSSKRGKNAKRASPQRKDTTIISCIVQHITENTTKKCNSSTFITTNIVISMSGHVLNTFL